MNRLEHWYARKRITKYDEILKPFGLNPKSAKFWDMGLSLISKYIDELEKLDRLIAKENNMH